jgi:arabinosaccharide transport system permease protein
VLNDSKKFTLPVVLTSIMALMEKNYMLLISGAVMPVVPIMILFFRAQKFFIEGMSTRSVKGYLKK